MTAKISSPGISFAKLPESYIRPESDRPNSSAVSNCEDIPGNAIDLSFPDRQLIVRQIAQACEEYGLFQVINHGIGKEAVEKMQRVAREFFSLPVDEKMKLYSDDPSKTTRLSTSFNVNKERTPNWRDYLRLHCYPIDKCSPEWPCDPSSYRNYNIAMQATYSPTKNYKVPTELRAVKPEACTLQMFLIGPLHGDKPQFHYMEKEKRRCMSDFFNRVVEQDMEERQNNGESSENCSQTIAWDKYRNVVSELEEEARG